MNATVTQAYMAVQRAASAMHRNAYLLLLAGASAMLLLLLLPDAAMAKCQPPGVPERAGSGVPGLLDSRDSTMEGDSYYGDYGFAGLTWHACDLGGPIAGNEWAGDPDAMLDTRIGNAGLGLAKWIAAAVTGLHAYNSDPSAALESFDSIVESMSNLVRELVVDQWMVLAIVIAAISMFVWAATQETRKVLVSGGSFLAAVAFISFVGTYPIQVAQAIDGVGSNAIAAADQRSLEVAGIDAEPEEAVGAIIHDNIMYPLWAKGALGNDDQTAAHADTWANDLYRAGATTYDQTDVSEDDKKKEYEQIYNELGKSEDTYMQTVMKGQGYNRAGVGAIMLVMTGIVGIIRVLAEFLIFSSLIVFRFIPIVGPIFAVLAVVPATRTIAKMGLNIVGAAAINAVIFGVVASLHTALTGFYANNLDFGLMLVMSLVTTYLIWKFTKPFRSVTQMVSPTSVSASISEGSDMNLMGKLMKGWALFNTGKAVGGRDDDRSPDETTPDRSGDDKTREHMVNEGPQTSNSGVDRAELLPSPAPMVAAPPAASMPSGELVPQAAEFPEVRHPEVGTQADVERSDTRQLAPGARPVEIEPQRDTERSDSPTPMPAAPAPAQPFTPSDPTTQPGSMRDKDDDADEQREQAHLDRTMETRIVSAIDRAAAQQGSANAESPATGEVTDRELPADVIRMDYDPSAQVYFNPRVDAQTTADFNQTIFVPGREPVTRTETVDGDEAQMGRDRA